MSIRLKLKKLRVDVGEKEPVWNCDECDKSYKTENGLGRHIKSKH